MAELKTRPVKGSVSAFIAALPDPVQRRDARKLASMMREVTGKSCLYVKRLADIDEAILRQLVEASVACMRDRYPTNQRRIARGSRR